MALRGPAREARACCEGAEQGCTWAQVNASPSLSSDTPADFHLKFAMVDAALSLADVDGQFAGNPPASFNGFDLICDNGSFMQARLLLPM